MLRWYFAFCIVATGLVLITQSVMVPERVGQQKQPAEKLSPILVLPGLMGSSLVIQRGAEKPPSPCYLGPKWQQLWINIDTVLNWVCFEKYMSLLINPDATTSPVPFANVTVPEGIWATAYLDPDSDWSRKKSEYLAHFYSYMQNLGYKLRHNLDAAPYDWRQSPLNYFKPGDFFEGLTARVERMFHQNGGQRVTLVGHSMGGAVGALFLSSYAPLEWKEKHIRRFVSVAGVYGGSLKALAGIMDGLNITFGAAELLRSLARKIPGLHSLVPISNQYVDLWKNQTLFAIGDYEYTTDMFPELWTQMGMSEYFNVLNQLRDVGWQKPPKVETFCALSLSFPTIEGIHIKSTRPIDRDSAKFFYGDGDGTVPRKSLTVCSNWSRIQDAPVRTAYFSSDHFDMMHADQNVWSFIFNVTNNDPLL